MNLRSLKNDLTVKKAGLSNALRALNIFQNGNPVNLKAVAETKEIISDLRNQIIDLEKNIRELEKRAKKKT
jgi:predicted  nucleic acid-binding Zn-ribbon protein